MIISSLCNVGTKFSGEERMEEKRREWCGVGVSDQSNFRPSDSNSKRQKPDLSISPNLTTKERKENVSAKVVALQQLVSPYGKTDTASVLLEAMDYIQFLHDQVKVLSAPYMESGLAAGESLWSKGLCVVPVEYTAALPRTNGADIWAPIKSTSPKLDTQHSHSHA